MIDFDSNICTDFAAASSREWLETNGIGGFASGTIAGSNSRRYHGLLTAATKPPLGRLTLVSKVEETVTVDGESFELSSNQYPESISPRGFEHLISFRLDPFPIWTYSVGGIEIEKRVFMVRGRNATVVTYTAKSKIRGGKPKVTMTLRPMLAFVDYHHLSHATAEFNGDFTTSDGSIEIKPIAEMPSLFVSHNGTGVERTGYWYRNFEYAIELERGFDFREDLFQPFEIAFDLSTPASVIFAIENDLAASDSAGLEKLEIKRRKALIKTAKAKTEFEQQLVLAADQFIVKRGEGYTVIAGYPWFSDWGRDTMIALPGLTLATGRPEIARGILLEFAKSASEGMIPNRFPDEGETPEYNTVDATLWYFEAVRAYVAATGDLKFVRDGLYETLADILAWHLRGARYNIHLDTDGLLYAGSPDVQLTWMDAKIGDLVITPRQGKAVEIQALWYNALMTMAELAREFGDDEDRAKYLSMADLARLSFNAVFWNEADQCLYDVVENGTRDASIRPNQIFAASLHHSMLDVERARKVVDKVEAELLTPVGLRSLSPRDPQYRPIYIGSPFDRDSSYHQGTVWGWLIGGFVDAARRAYPDRPVELSGFERHLREAGVGQISEIFDANAPHAPRGCPAQAWSVAEVLRVIR
ncbi:MAG TPA: amylo-alpha-1,6-glucosidase [Pyrinomonadaceae bacterium]|nr:amylo-alpha-1,6-glucosidase [Pyrinomonadaceae bacterium]